MSIMRHSKVFALPSEPTPNTYYLVQSGGRAEQYVTTDDGEIRNVGNSAMIGELIADAFAESLSQTGLLRTALDGKANLTGAMFTGGVGVKQGLAVSAVDYGDVIGGNYWSVISLVNEVVDYEGARGSSLYYYAGNRTAPRLIGGITGIFTERSGDQYGGCLVFLTKTMSSAVPSERMRITSGGYVGVNTSTPGRRFDVRDASNPQMRLSFSDSIYSEFQTSSAGHTILTNTGGGFFFGGYAGFGTANPGKRLSIAGADYNTGDGQGLGGDANAGVGITNTATDYPGRTSSLAFYASNENPAHRLGGITAVYTDYDPSGGFGGELILWTKKATESAPQARIRLMHDGQVGIVGTLLLLDGTQKAVVFGAPDSGGAGFKMLRVAN